MWAGIIGHGRVLDLLEREIAAPAGAYLFVGASGIGKSKVARAFAAALVCPDDGDHDELCRVCRLVDAGTFADVVLVAPEERQSIGVDQARAAIQQATLRPVEADRKVFLLEEADSLTDQAANSLLKTLEETTPTTVFILVAESEDDLPITVASRCRTVHFGRVDESELSAGLEERGVDRAQADALARTSGGRPGLALTLASNEEVAGFRSAWLAIPARVTNRPGESFVLAQEMLDRADHLVGDDVDGAAQKRRARLQLLATGLEILASWYADAASVQLGVPIRNRDVPMADLTSISPRRAVENAERALDAVMDLQANLRPQLLLTALFTSLGGSDL